MKANELRIGNWVNAYGKDCKIESGEQIDDCNQYPEKFRGIPITEERLLITINN